MSEPRAVDPSPEPNRCFSPNNLTSGHGLRKTIMGIDVLGADVLIVLQYRQDSDGCTTAEFVHASARGTQMPRVEIAHHGVRIGCSFVTADALELIAKEYEKFGKERTRVVQP